MYSLSVASSAKVIVTTQRVAVIARLSANGMLKRTILSTLAQIARIQVRRRVLRVRVREAIVH